MNNAAEATAATLDERVKHQDMTPQEAAAAFGEEETSEAVPEGDPKPVDGHPEWAPPLPEKLRVPPGVQVTWIRIRAGLTVAPHKGDRVCAVWALSELEERQAVTRARGDQYQMLSELAKATVRTVDQHMCDRTATPGHPGAIAKFWGEIGPKGRSLVRTYYSRTHTMSDEETQDFLLNCFATRTVEPG